MDRLFLLIGPSGVGKSSLGEFASEGSFGCKFFDLDDIVGREIYRTQGPEAFFVRSRSELENIKKANRESICLVAVGAGMLQFESEDVEELLGRHNTIAITAPPKEVLLRNPYPNRSLDEFKKTEYSRRRKSMYESANFKFRVGGLSKERAEEEFVKYMKEEILKEG